MAQTKDGAIKCAAKKVGITVAEYLRFIEAGLKRCTACKQWKPTVSFAKDRSRFDGLKSKCGDCAYIPKTNNFGIRQRRFMSQKGLGWCRKCEQWLAAGLLTKNGLCKPHEAEDARLRYAANERYRRERQQHAHSRKRKTEPIKPEVQIQVLAEFARKCAYCGKMAMSFDHIVPISKGGNAEIQNIVPACITCNSSKKNRDIFQWITAKNIVISEKLKLRLKRAL